mgnify:FL=1
MRLFLALLVLCPVWAVAETDDFVLGVFRLERCAFMSSSESARADRVDLCRDILDETTDAYGVLEGSEPPELVEALAPNWEQLVELYERGFDEPTVFRDHYTADDIRMTRIQLIESLGERLPTPPNPVALAVLVERAASEYIWRAESTLAGGMTATEILDLETMVMDMDKQFDVLRQRHGQDLGLRQAYTRYQFIREIGRASCRERVSKFV